MYTMNSHFSVLCASHLGPQLKSILWAAHITYFHGIQMLPPVTWELSGPQDIYNELMTLLSSHAGYLSFSLQFSSHRTWQPLTNTHNIQTLWDDIYWFGCSLFGFPHTILQENPNFLAKPINSHSRLGFFQVFKEALRHKCRVVRKSVRHKCIPHKQNQQASWFASICPCIFTWEAMLMKNEKVETRRKVMRLWHLYLWGRVAVGGPCYYRHVLWMWQDVM